VGSSAFVDTGYLVALLDPRDRLHDRAMALAEDLAQRGVDLVTTDAVVLELANYFSRGPLRVHAIRWIRALRAGAGWEVVPVERATLLAAEERFARHADKFWSLTDCHSMEVMRRRGIREVATADGGFTQAGFKGLLR
jgi:uncharacterized protein